MKFAAFFRCIEASFQAPYCLLRILRNFSVFRACFAFAFCQVAEDCKINSCLRIGPGCCFQLTDDFIDTLFRIQKARDYHHNSAIFWQFSFEIKFGKGKRHAFFHVHILCERKGKIEADQQDQTDGKNYQGNSCPSIFYGGKFDGINQRTKC